MSEETRESLTTDPAAVDAKIAEVVDKCMEAVDNVCNANSFDASAMIFLSTHASAHLMARGLFFATGPEARMALKNKLMENVGEILESAAQHIDKSERELNSGIIRPN